LQLNKNDHSFQHSQKYYRSHNDVVKNNVKYSSNVLQQDRQILSKGRLLDGHLILVTGASSGIGLATTRVILQECGNVIMIGRNVTKLNDQYENITSELIPNIDYCQNNVQPFVDKYVADVRNITRLREVFGLIQSKYGRLNGATNIAGISGPIEYLDSYKMDEWIGGYWDPILNNLYGTINSIRSEIEFWKSINARNGIIINAASVNAFVGAAEGDLYVASKFGISGITKSTALAYAYPNANNSYLQLRVNAIAPGLIDTPLTRNQARALIGLQPFECYNDEDEIIQYGCPDIGENDELWLQYKQLILESNAIPIGRIISPQEMANVIVFLLSNYSTAVTGDVWLADGGYTAQ